MFLISGVILLLYNVKVAYFIKVISKIINRFMIKELKVQI